MADPGRYFRILRESRDIEFALSRTAEQATLDLLESWLDDITPVVLRSVGGPAAAQLEPLVRRLADDLARRLAENVGSQVRLGAEQIGESHREALNSLLRSDPLGGGFSVPSQGVAARAAATVLSRDELAESFVTIRDEVAEDANRIIEESILRGREPDAGAFARRLRHYVVGAESLPDRFLDDQRRIGIESLEELGLEATEENLERIRSEARTVAHRATRIAVTETGNATHEARVQHMTESPVVAAVEWFLSQRHPRFDVCDILAKEDLYGLGDGLYPPPRVPARPHPFDLCGTRPKILPPERWGETPPSPDLVRDPASLAAAAGLPPSSQEMILRAVEAGDSRVDVRLGEASPDIRTGAGTRF